MPEVRHDGCQDGAAMRLVWATFAQDAITLPQMDNPITAYRGACYRRLWRALDNTEAPSIATQGLLLMLSTLLLPHLQQIFDVSLLVFIHSVKRLHDSGQ